MVQDQFRLSQGSLHGYQHWKRVERLGKYIGATNGSDIAIVSHFAYLHDAVRHSESEDVLHGLRAGDYVQILASQKHISLNQSQLNTLVLACKTHNTITATILNPTLATCFDADRLDLWRMGIQPIESLLFTDKGKAIARDQHLYEQIVNQRSL